MSHLSWLWCAWSSDTHLTHTHSLTHWSFSCLKWLLLFFLFSCVRNNRRVGVWIELHSKKWYQQLSRQAIIDRFVTPSSHLWLVIECRYLIFLLLLLLLRFLVFFLVAGSLTLARSRFLCNSSLSTLLTETRQESNDDSTQVERYFTWHMC